MPVDTHIVELIDGSKQLRTDRVLVGVLTNVALTAGLNGVTTITFAAGQLPADSSGNPLYGVAFTPSQNLTFTVAKTATTITLTANGTVSASQTADVFIYA